MDKNNNYRLETLLAHNTKDDRENRALTPPIAQTSTFYFDNMDQVKKAFNFETDDYVYTRGNNPTIRLFEEKMALIEKGNAAVAFASGMAAISSVLFSLLKPQDQVVFHRTLYGSTHTVAKTLLKKYDIDSKFIDLTNSDNLNALIDDAVKVIYFETPSNPNLELIDIQKIKKIIGDKNIKIVVDNTFLSPYFQNPLENGADIVLHSATKYISGHGDVVAGVVVSKDIDYIHRLKFDYMTEFGGVISPFNAWLLLRGLKTLHIRMKAHEANAIKIADYLNSHKKVTNVIYPSLESYPFTEVVSKQMRGFGAIITFEVKGSREDAVNFIDHLKLFKIAVSLGDIESLIEMPSEMTHLGYDKSELESFGLTEKMIRISVGLENHEDLIADLEKSLDRIK
ncbi:MAG: aminotransferase class I/II-fold pyridoxal phosphate-dependent enzyme [Clostridiales bacterium]|nr:aminotransferase class I/II-fold pyridoxal phosphate-dependent enzyme [Clostridiales bacterium]